MKNSSSTVGALLHKLRHAALIFTAALAVASCSDDDPASPDDTTPGDGSEVIDPDGETHGTMTAAVMTGFVSDTEGNPLANVTVKSGTHSAVTNEAGAFTFSEVDVNDGRTLMEFSKDGYFSVSRAAQFSATDVWNVVMVKKDGSAIATTVNLDAAQPAEVAVKGMKVKFTGAFKNSKTGKPYSGKVKVDMLYLDPNDENFAEMMPGGDLRAVRTDGSRVSLISYGMSQVNMTGEDGQALQLDDNTPATVTFPIPDGMGENPHSEIPLWSYDESTGNWVEEGMAHLTNGVYVGEVKHFSWVNLDYPEEQATVSVNVVDSEGDELPFQRVRIGQITVMTDKEGRVSQTVPASTAFAVSVKSEWYGNYSPEVSVNVPALAPRQDYHVDLVLPHLYKVEGRLLSNGKAAVGYVWLRYGARNSVRVVTDNEGRFELTLPVGYTGPATVRILSGVELSRDITIANKDIDLGDIEVGGTPSAPARR